MMNKRSELAVEWEAPSDDRARSHWTAVGAEPPSNIGLSPGTRFERWESMQRQLLQRWTLRLVRRHLTRCSRIVDLGCGNGDFTARLAKLTDEIVGVDFSPGLVAQAVHRLRGHRGAEAVCGDIRAFHALGTPDLVSIGGVLMYMPDLDAEALLCRVARSMRPGGLLLHREYVAHHDGEEARKVGSSASYRRPGSRYRMWAAEAGFSLVAQQYSPAIFAEQAIYDTIGLRLAWLTRMLSLVPVLAMRAAMSRVRACSWTSLYQLQ